MRISDWSSDVCSSDLIVIPVKTENHRKCASYWSRATQTMLRTGYRTKVDTCGMDVEKTPERFVKLEAYFAAPHIHGEPAFGDKAAKAPCRYHQSAAARARKTSTTPRTDRKNKP